MTDGDPTPASRPAGDFDVPSYQVDQTSTSAAWPAETATAGTTGRQRSRGRSAVISALLGLVLVGLGLYLIIEFGARIVDATSGGRNASIPDIVLEVIGAVCLLVGVLLDGWSPWATALPGLVLTGFGVWSLVSIDAANRVTDFANTVFSRADLVLWGVPAWVLVIGVLLLGASGAVTIARSAGRTRGRS